MRLWLASLLTLSIAARGAPSPAPIAYMHYDTPRAHAPSRRAEKRAAERARKDLERILSRTDAIALKVHVDDRYDRTMTELTELVVDGEPLHRHMMRGGNAVPYADGKRIDWCKRLRG